jgi:hypothetical protein
MKHVKIMSALTVALLISACATPGDAGTGASTSAAAQIPAEVVAKVCPPLQTALSGLNALVGLPASARADLDAVTPIIAGVCAAGATINLANLQTLQQTALPTIANTIKASGMAAEQQNSLILDITAAQIVLSTLMQTYAQTHAQAYTQTPVGTVATK